MEFNQIRYFLSAADTLNFTRAAELCNITQPSLTRAIKALEDDLGGPLFRREGRYTHLTELGNEMKWRFSVIRAQAEEAMAAARQLHNLERAELNIGIMRTVGPRRIMRFLADFEKEYPSTKITITEIVSATMSERLLNNEIDVAFLGVPTPLHERFDSYALYSEPMVVLFPEGHRFAQLDKVPATELQNERYLIRPHCEFAYFFGMLPKMGVKVETPFGTDREDWAQDMVATGLGVCMFPAYSITHPGLDYRPLTNPDIERTVELVTVAGRRHSPALSAFIKASKSADWGE